MLGTVKNTCKYIIIEEPETAEDEKVKAGRELEHLWQVASPVHLWQLL